MGNAKRPSLEKRQTRASKAKQDEALDDGLSLTLDGKTYSVRMGDLSALDARELRAQVGMSFVQLMIELTGDGVDIDVIAAVIWLARFTGGERRLTYQEVAAEIGYDVIDKVEIGDATPEGDGDSPEA